MANASHQLSVSPDMVVRVKWVLEGVLMPGIGIVGLFGERKFKSSKQIEAVNYTK